MRGKNTNRIARVVPSVTLSGSALARSRKFSPLGEWLLKYEDQIIFSKYRTRWIEPWKIYIRPDGFIWLLLWLPLRLIKGKYYLFRASARDPQGIVTFFISKLLRKPIILSDTFYCWPERLLACFIWPFCRFIVSHATIFVVPSQRCMNFWKSAGISRKKIRLSHVFMSTVEIDDKHVSLAKELKKKLGVQKTVLFVGRLVKGKGVEYLIKAFAKVSKEIENVGLIIVGGGPERNRLQALCDDIKLGNVLFTGFIDKEELGSYYFLSDIFVLPSINLKMHEEWGIVVNEAMSVGKPIVVTTAVGCAYELVKEHVNGFIVPEKSIEALYNVIKKLLKDQELRMKMGKESKRIITEAFTYQHAIENTKAILNEALMGIKFH